MTFFYHISLQYFKPYRSTVLEMHPSTRIGLTRHGGILLQPSVLDASLGTDLNDWRPYLTMYEALQAHDLRKIWHIDFMLLCDGDDRVGRSFVPGLVEFTVLGGTEACVWQGGRRRRRVLGVLGAGAEVQGEFDHDHVAEDEGDGPHGGASDPEQDEDGEDGGGNDDSGDDGGDGDVAALLAWFEAQEGRAEGDGPGQEGDHDSDSDASSGYASADYQSVDSDDLAQLPDGASDLSSDEESDASGSDPPSPPPLPPPVLPPAPPARAPPVGEDRRPRLAQDGLSIFVGTVLQQGGAIKYNRSNDEFYIKCFNPAHGDRCIATRSAHASRMKTKLAQGRPLGFLAAWAAASFDCPDKKSHLDSCRPSFDVRRARRLDLDKEDQRALVQDFCSKERQPRDGEDIEPLDCP